MRVVDARPERAEVDQIVYRYRAHPGSLTFQGGLEVDLAEEQLALCRSRIAETRGTPGLNRRYRRWHSWESAYLTAQRVRRGEYREAVTTLAIGVRTYPLLPLVLPGQIAHHLRMRRLHR